MAGRFRDRAAREAAGLEDGQIRGGAGWEAMDPRVAQGRARPGRGGGAVLPLSSERGESGGSGIRLEGKNTEENLGESPGGRLVGSHGAAGDSRRRQDA